MGEKTGIEWTDSTWNPIRARNMKTGKIGWHCEHVSEACRFCYAESMNRRLGTGLDFKPGHRDDIEVFLDEKMLLAPLRWKKPRRIFVNSMTDTFADFVKEEWLDHVFAVMALAPRHIFQVLTKRPERMRHYIAEMTRQEWWKARIYPRVRPNVYPAWPLPNVWLGVSAEDQATADERIPLLLQTPAAIRFVSLEPLLGPIDLGMIKTGPALWLDVIQPQWPERFPLGRGLDWVIAGGESGRGARPSHPEWFRSLCGQCAAAGVPFFFKQRGEWTWVGDEEYDAENFPNLERERVRCMRPDGTLVEGYGGGDEEFVYRVGKKAAGRRLDGIEHNGMPGVP